MTEELPCGCMAEVWVPRAGAPDGPQRIAVVNPDCELHKEDE